MNEKLYDLYWVRIDPRSGEATGEECKVGGNRWVPMTLEQAVIVWSKFTIPRNYRIDFREVVTQ